MVAAHREEAAACWRLPGGAEARVSGSEKNQALITMLEERNSCGIG
jgi:hypothetical protein